MKNRPVHFTVLMSAYNGSQFITEQLDSIRHQTRKPDEVLIIDDCSTDNTYSIVEKYISEFDLHETWRIIRNSRNQGWKRNFIEGIDKVEGEIIFFSDQDDVWLQNKLEVYENILSNDDTINVITSSEILWDGKNKPEFDKIEDFSFDKIRLSDSSDNYYIHSSGCTMAFRKSYYNRIRKYYVEGMAHDDFLWKMSALDGTLAKMKGPSVYHRIHGTNESRKKRTLLSSIQHLKTDILVCDSLNKRVDDEFEKDFSELKQIIDHKKTGFYLRLDAIENKNIIKSIYSYIAYHDIYRSIKQLIGDILLYMNLIRRNNEQ